MYTISVIFTLASLMGIFSACENASEEPVLKSELIFPEAKEIKVPAYSYSSESGIINVYGDESFSSGIVDTLTSTPVLSWDSVMATQIVAAIFIQPIRVENGYISNTEDMVWIWHSGLEKGKDGKVAFMDGMKIANGDISNLSTPEPLLSSTRYYWGVWSWNASGVNITHASRPLTFYVK